jgi:hypothetical protein
VWLACFPNANREPINPEPLMSMVIIVNRTDKLEKKPLGEMIVQPE